MQEHLHGNGNSEVSLARSCRSDAEDQFMAHQRINIFFLHLRARADGALLRLDLPSDDIVPALTLRHLRHADGTIHFACCHIKTRFQPLIKIAQHAIGLFTRFGLAGNHQLIAAGAGIHTQTLFDADEMLIMLAEQFAQKSVVIKGYDEIFAFSLEGCDGIRCGPLI